MIEKLILELEKVKKEFWDDRKCICIDSANVYLVDEKKKLSIADYISSFGSSFDPYFAHCYLEPGKVTTIKEIYIHCLECDIKRKLVNDYIKGLNSEVNKDLYEKFGLNFDIK